jgi:hypothetical protein
MKKIFISKKISIKRLIILALAATFALPLAASDGNDTIFLYREKYIVKKKNGIFKSKDYYSDFFLDLGANRLDSRNMFTGTHHESAAGFPKLIRSKSTSFSMYAMFGRKISGMFSITSGLGIDWVNYRFSKDVTIREIDDVATQVDIASVVNDFASMKKSKLTASYLQVPLMVKMHFRKFFLSAGVTGGVNIGAHTKIVFSDRTGDKHRHRDYDIHPAIFRYGYSVRAGFRNISLYANYYISPLFENGKGPRVYPFAIGASLNLAP